jgi:hypothetical protein
MRIQRFLAGTVLLSGLFLLAAPKAAGQNSTITASVIDSNGSPVSNVTVHLYVGRGACNCIGNNQCRIAPTDTKTTGKNGRAMFMQLGNDIDYSVCMDDRCQYIGQQCTSSDCQFIGNCAIGHTAKHGGNRLVVIHQ